MTVRAASLNFVIILKRYGNEGAILIFSQYG
jgi:hypothetical protein